MTIPLLSGLMEIILSDNKLAEDLQTDPVTLATYHILQCALNIRKHAITQQEIRLLASPTAHRFPFVCEDDPRSR